MKDPTPIRPFEPVAFFEFENETDTSVTVEIDFKRSCKYIMLKPVGFRKKKSQQASGNQNVNNQPMEIEFFGVMGSSYPQILS